MASALAMDKCSRLDHPFGKVLVDKSTGCPPLISIEHDENMVPLRDQMVRDIRVRPVTVYVTLVYGIFDNTVGHYHRHRGTQLECV